jgi:hypothetical protein
MNMAETEEEDVEHHDSMCISCCIFVVLALCPLVPRQPRPYDLSIYVAAIVIVVLYFVNAMIVRTFVLGARRDGINRASSGMENDCEKRLLA